MPNPSEMRLELKRVLNRNIINKAIPARFIAIYKNVVMNAFEELPANFIETMFDRRYLPPIKAHQARASSIERYRVGACNECIAPLRVCRHRTISITGNYGIDESKVTSLGLVVHDASFVGE